MLPVGFGNQSLWRGFFFGVTLTVAVLLTFLTASLVAVQKRGITVHIDTAPLAAQIRAELAAQVEREVPAVIAELRRELPHRVANAATEKIGSTPLNVGPFELRLPEPMVQEIRSRLETSLQQGFDRLSREGGTTNAIVQRINSRVEHLISSRLRTLLSGQRFDVKVGPVRLPVVVRAS